MIAGGKPVLLVINRMGADCHISKNIIQIPIIFRIKHFISTRKPVSISTHM